MLFSLIFAVSADYHVLNKTWRWGLFKFILRMSNITNISDQVNGVENEKYCLLQIDLYHLTSEFLYRLHKIKKIKNIQKTFVNNTFIRNRFY